MRFFTTAIALAAVLVFGFQANPASANCHAKLEKAKPSWTRFQATTPSEIKSRNS
tara:strand:- start:358 stop:522 length:165 start_codon:yes stop_codon:yes gene_type:complete